jgi:hypothetical protein
MGHTPGPWKVVDRLYIWTDDDWQCEVAKVCDEDQTCKLWQADDDARLIAAAPDLLSALKRLLPLWEESIGWEKVYMDMADDARAAIAKAEGRSE